MERSPMDKSLPDVMAILTKSNLVRTYKTLCNFSSKQSICLNHRKVICIFVILIQIRTIQFRSVKL